MNFSGARRAAAENRQQFSFSRSGGKALADPAVREHFCDSGQSAQVHLVFILGNDEQNDELHGGVVDRVELYPVLRAAKDRDDLIDLFRERMRDGDAGTYAGARFILPFLEKLQHLVPMFRLQAVGREQMVDQLNDRRPAFGGTNCWDNLVFR